MAMANPVLLWFVGYSNLTSIVIVTLCFIAMTIFIGFVSMNGEYTGRSSHPLGVEQKSMVKVSNPFVLQLEQKGRKLADGIILRLSSLLPSKVCVLWGPKIHPFHDMILKPGAEIRETFTARRSEDCFELDSLHCDTVQFSKPGKHIINFPCPAAVSSETLGDMPRKRYPVTVFVFVPEDLPGRTNDENQLDEQNRETEDSNTIAGLISVIHLQDEKVTQHSHIITQYVKTVGVPIYSLQPLYLSGEPNHPAQQQQQHQQQEQFPSAGSGDNSHDVFSRASVSEEDLDVDSTESLGACAFKESIQRDVTKDSSKNVCSCDKLSSTDEGSKTTLRKLDIQTNMSPPQGKAADFVDSKCKMCSASDDNGEIHDCNKPQNKDFYEESRRNLDVRETNRDDFSDERDCQSSTHAECVVCQTRAAKCALLPCRHACVCLGCLKLLDRCPMCRGAIESYFVLKNSSGFEDESSEEESDDGDDVLQNLQQEAVSANFVQMWQRFNNRLNGMLGFR